MSSPDSEPSKPPARPPVGWGLWRRLMLGGALVLLANALAYALIDPDPPRAVWVVVNSVGYILLAIGFGQRMRDRKG